MQNLIPPKTLKAIRNYVEHGVRPGDFLCAVLCNDLFKAIMAADAENREALDEIVHELYWNVPGDCWGSPEAVAAWLKKKAKEEPPLVI